MLVFPILASINLHRPSTARGFDHMGGSANLAILQHLDSYCVSVARFEKRLGLQQRRASYAPGKSFSQENMVDQFRVLASTAMKPGTRLTTLSPTVYCDPFLTPRVGSVYFLITAPQVHGRIREFGVWRLRNGEADIAVRDEIEPERRDEQNCVLALETTATALQRGTSIRNMVLLSLLDCVQSSNYRSNDQALYFMGSEGQVKPPIPIDKVRPEDEVTIAIRRVAASSPPELRYRLFGLLSDWLMDNTSDGMFEALRLASRDPKAFINPDSRVDSWYWVPLPRFFPRTSGHVVISQDYKHEIILDATNERVVALLLSEWGAPKALPNQFEADKQLAKRRIWSRYRPLLMRLLFALGASEGRPDLLPHYAWGEYFDLESKVEAWKNYFGFKQKPDPGTATDELR